MKNKNIEYQTQSSLAVPATFIAKSFDRDSNAFSNVVNLFPDRPVKSNDTSVSSRLMREAKQLDW